MHISIDTVKIVKDLGKGGESYDARVDVARSCLMKLIVLTEAASESCALHKAIEDIVKTIIGAEHTRGNSFAASFRISPESEQELE
jgi:hypothetical protein